MISFITVGRDDDYGSGFLSRLHISISKNIEMIENFDMPYEYLVVEWCPVGNYLIYNEEFKDLFNNKSLMDIIVKPSVSLEENLNPKIFYEYFAKNVGIRMSKYDVLVLLNSDVILPEETMKLIIDLVKNNFDQEHYYKLLYRVQVDDDLKTIKRECLHRPKSPDAVIGGFYAGDFLLVDKNALIKYGQGYDETNPGHRTIGQTAMDGEMLWNLYSGGITLQLLDADYLHINHGRSSSRGGLYNMSGYVNKPNWGFVDYPKKILSEKLIEIG
ncbi:MAG TPA: hypothetical protein VI336_01545 [Candidatus Saccharimonadales bacterium]|nr:hypothetical protein [Candidatus Saccharimonadales bacterium]